MKNLLNQELCLFFECPVLAFGL